MKGNLFWSGAWRGGLAGFIAAELAGIILATVLPQWDWMMFLYGQIYIVIPAIIIGLVSGLAIALTFQVSGLWKGTRSQTTRAGAWVVIFIFAVFCANILVSDWRTGYLAEAAQLGQYRWLMFASPFYILSGAWVGRHLSIAQTRVEDDGEEFNLAQIPARSW